LRRGRNDRFAIKDFHVPLFPFIGGSGMWQMPRCRLSIGGCLKCFQNQKLSPKAAEALRQK
jgi:hypothetical protein